MARAIHPDLERLGSFVTLFHAQLDVRARRLVYVDAGHGHVLLRRAGGAVEKLAPGWVPLGIRSEGAYQEGTVSFEGGDALVLYSDGLVEARPDARLNVATIAGQLDGAASARDMVNRLVDLAGPAQRQRDDLTVLVLLCTWLDDVTLSDLTPLQAADLIIRSAEA
jgi:phosphoserine phosphatase RsbU/P